LYYNGKKQKRRQLNNNEEDDPEPEKEAHGEIDDAEFFERNGGATPAPADDLVEGGVILVKKSDAASRMWRLGGAQQQRTRNTFVVRRLI